jgi:hypothetical protein
MAVTFNTDRLQGLSGVTVNGVYARIQSVTVKKYDTNRPGGTDGDGNPILIDAVHWRCLYDVVLHASAAVRNASGEFPEWGNRLNSSEIDHFTCTYDPTSNSNPYAQAYADLKTKLAAGGSPIASSIADA